MPLPRAVSVGNKITQIVPYNPDRVVLAVFNVGNYVAYISPDMVDVDKKGFPINPGVGITWKKVEGDKPEVALWAIAPSGTTELRIWEEFK